MKRNYSYHNNDVCLYLVATPIGNLEDMTYRAVNILNMVDYIYAEDTRNSRVLLNHYGIKTPLYSYHEHNEEIKLNEILNHLINKKNIAIISDAGLPLISDPGYVLVKEVINQNIAVTTIPGACAQVSALVSSGLTPMPYSFYGFLDSKKTKIQKMLKLLKENTNTLVFYEAPHRIKETLNCMLEVLGDRYIVIARELTKKFEEYIRGNISQIIENVDVLKGEIVLMVSGFVKQEESSEELLDILFSLIEEGLRPKEAILKVSSDYNVNKNTLYDLYLKNKDN